MDQINEPAYNFQHWDTEELPAMGLPDVISSQNFYNTTAGFNTSAAHPQDFSNTGTPDQMLFGPATASHVQPTASGYRSRYPLVGTGPVNQANPSYFAPPFHYMQTSVPGYRPRYPLHHTEPVNRANSPYFAPPFHYESASATPDAAYPHHSATQSHYASPLQYHPAPTTHGSYASPLQYPYAQYSPAQYPSAQYPPAQYPPAQTTSTDYAALSTLTKECLRRSTANSEGFTDATTEDINDDAIFGPVLIKPHARSCDGFEGHETTLGLPHRVYREWSNSPYDNAWMEMAGIAENILQDFTSKEKLEHLILKGALHIGDELYVNMPYTDGKETMDVEKSARIMELNKLADMSFFVNGELQGELKTCKGPTNILQIFNQLDPKTPRRATSQAWKQLEVRRGGVELGSLFYVRQKFHRWQIELDAWSATMKVWTRARRHG